MSLLKHYKTYIFNRILFFQLFLSLFTHTQVGVNCFGFCFFFLFLGVGGIEFEFHHKKFKYKIKKKSCWSSSTRGGPIKRILLLP